MSLVEEDEMRWLRARDGDEIERGGKGNEVQGGF